MLRTVTIVILLALAAGCVAYQPLELPVVVDGEVINAVWYNSEKTLEEAIEDANRWRKGVRALTAPGSPKKAKAKSPMEILK